MVDEAAPDTGSTESRLRLWLMLLAAAVFPGTIVELILERHYDKMLQYLPLVLCAAAFAALAAVIVKATSLTIWAMRVVMVSMFPVTLLGMWEHFDGNMDFQREIRPNAGFWTQFDFAIHGAAPLLAPGILALAAGVALIASYRHPALGGRDD